MFAFSTCWNSQRHTDGRAMLNEIRGLGFEFAELSHGIRLSLVEGIQKAVSAGEIRITSLHNFCPLPVGVSGPAPDYYRPSSDRETERQLAVRHTLRTVEFAATVGAKAVVLHLGSVGMRNYTERLMKMYAQGRTNLPRFERLRVKAFDLRARKRQAYLDNVSRTLDAVAPRVRELKLKLGLETRLNIEDIPNEAEVAELRQRIGADVIGYWHDVGHAQIRENLGITSHEALLQQFRGQTFGMHLQDFAPPVFDHQAPGTGTFDFARLVPFVTDEMILAWEIHPNCKAEAITEGCRHVHEQLRSPVGA
jgi:sugar phosphate isomerase/epimerase